MEYAVFISGGKQYIARQGESVDVDKMKVDVGSEISFDEVLLTSRDGAVHVGQPMVKNAEVKATVTGQIRGPKILVLKYKPQIRYRKRQGHRQYYTRVKIDEILFPDGKKQTKAKVEKAPEPKQAAEKAPEPKQAVAKPDAAAQSERSLDDIDLNSMLKAELEALAEELGVMPEEGSGAGGNVLVKDLRDAIRKALE